MYRHNGNVPCNNIENLEGPAMTSDLKIIYPCNKAGCNQDCLCDLCIKRLKCPRMEHKEHLKESNSECGVTKESQCKEHNIDHPKNFNKVEDISVDKNIFYHNLQLVDQPRQHSTGKLSWQELERNVEFAF